MAARMLRTQVLTGVAAFAATMSLTVVPVAQGVAAPLAGTNQPGQGTVSSVETAGSAAAAASDYGSIFSGENAALAGSGWTTCATPVLWSLDTRGLSASLQKRQIANLTWAFGEWSKASGLTFQYAGSQDLAYDDKAFTVKPADGSAVQGRHIYLDFVTQGESSRLSGGTVGLGSPSQVMPTTKEIISGEAIFRTDYVQTGTTKQLRSLYLHELGHVLGLSHATVTANVMYPIVTTNTHLGAGDVNGVRAMEKACSVA